MELKSLDRFVVHEGKVCRENGSIGEYRVVNDKPIIRDDSVVADTLTFLQETYDRYSFLWWNCFRPYFSQKVLGEPSHELRLFLSDIMICEGFSDEENHNLFPVSSQTTNIKNPRAGERPSSGLRPALNRPPVKR